MVPSTVIAAHTENHTKTLTYLAGKCQIFVLKTG